jgi:hypothetical protein
MGDEYLRSMGGWPFVTARPLAGNWGSRCPGMVSTGEPSGVWVECEMVVVARDLRIPGDNDRHQLRRRQLRCVWEGAAHLGSRHSSGAASRWQPWSGRWSAVLQVSWRGVAEKDPRGKEVTPLSSLMLVDRFRWRRFSGRITLCPPSSHAKCAAGTQPKPCRSPHSWFQKPYDGLSVTKHPDDARCDPENICISSECPQLPVGEAAHHHGPRVAPLRPL